jgi:hypothetical protein
LTPSGKRGLDFGELGLDALDDVQRILARAHDDHAAYDLALTV